MCTCLVTAHARHKSLLLSTWLGVLFLVRFINFDQTIGFYWSYSNCLFLCALDVLYGSECDWDQRSFWELIKVHDLSPNCEKLMDQKCTATIWHFEPLWSRVSEGLEFTLESREFRCFEAKIEESEKAGSLRESNPGHLACAASTLPLSHDNWTITTILYMYCLKCSSRTPGSNSVPYFPRVCCVSQHIPPHYVLIKTNTCR